MIKKVLKTLMIVIFIPIALIGQERDSTCVEYEIIEMYNLRMSIIKKQKLDVWPTIVEIKKLSELNAKVTDSLILFIAETDYGDKLRMTNTSNLTKYAEMDYKGDCPEEGTISTDLKFGKIWLNKMTAEIFCRKEKYTELVIKN